jgi:hypothetical protein
MDVKAASPIDLHFDSPVETKGPPKASIPNETNAPTLSLQLSVLVLGALGALSFFASASLNVAVSINPVTNTVIVANMRSFFLNIVLVIMQIEIKP